MNHSFGKALDSFINKFVSPSPQESDAAPDDKEKDTEKREMSGNFERDGTSSALLEQLVYIDNFMSNTSEGTPNLDMDGQLSLDLAAFADDSFIFPDAEKIKPDKSDDDIFNHFEANGNHLQSNSNNSHHNHNHNNNHNPSSNNNNHNAGNLNSLASNNSNNKGLNGDDSGNNTHSGTNTNIHSDISDILNKASPAEYNPDMPGLNISELPKVPVPPGAQSSLVAAGLSQNQIDLLAALVAQHQQTDNFNTTPPSSNAGLNIGGSPTVSVRQHSQISNFQDLHQVRLGASSIGGIDESQSTSPGGSSTTSSIRLVSDESSITSGPNTVSSTFASFNSSAMAHSNSASSSSNRRSMSYEIESVTSELDKRRRNTAASARFRIKKKQKEKEMEQMISSLSDSTKSLELKIQQLEMENKLLRNLIVEKGSKRSDDELRQLKERVQVRGEDQVKREKF